MVEPPVDTAAVGMLPPFCVVKIWSAAFATSCKQLHWLELCVDYACKVFNAGIVSMSCQDWLPHLDVKTAIVSHVFVSMPLLGEPTPYRVSFAPRIERASGERMGLWSFRCPVWSGVILWFSLVMDQNISKDIKSIPVGTYRTHCKASVRITLYYIHLRIFAIHKLRLQFCLFDLRHLGPRNAWSLGSESIVFQAFHILCFVSAHAIPKIWDSLWSHGRKIPLELDDGWPESVEEQGLLLLVWRHNFTNNILKMCYRQSRRGVSRRNSEKCKTIVCIANTLTHRSFYTQTLLPHKSFYTQKFLHTKAFTHRSFYRQTLSHTDPFTHRRLYTQKLLHTEAFTYRSFYTQMLLHRHFYTQELLLHTNALTHRSFYT